VGGGGLESSAQGCRQVVGSVEHSDETVGSIEGGEFLYWPRNCELLSKGPSLCCFLELLLYLHCSFLCNN